MSGPLDPPPALKESPPTPTPEEQKAPDPNDPVGQQEARGRPRRPKRVTAVLAAGTLVATFANVGVAFYQWNAVERQAKIMERQTKAMEEANAINRGSLELAKSTAASSDAATAVSLKLTRQNLEVTREALAFSRGASEATQRAWVVMAGTSTIDLSPDKEISIAVELKNVGKSPANLRNSIAGIAVGATSGFTTNPDYAPRGGEPSVATLGPDQPTYVNLKAPPLPKPIIEAIQSGKVRLYVYGRILYSDIFKRSRRTLFCSYYVAPGRGLDICATHNEWD